MSFSPRRIMTAGTSVHHYFWKRKGYRPLDPNVIRAYGQARNFSVKKKLVCYAAHTNMYFNIQGAVGACWLRFAGAGCDPDWYPQKTIKEIWFGERYTKLREHIQHDDLSYKCQVCRDNLCHGNFVSLLAKAYDNEYRVKRFPVMMEMELDNVCNLECIMCNGLLSSSIRKNREKKPRIKSPYDVAFIRQLEEFIPFLQEVRFNGGEPFLSDINYRAWEKMIEINPRMKIAITTNGTVLNDRVKDLLRRGRFHINLSIDSLRKDVYETIRKNAVLDQTMSHIRYFEKYCRENRTAFVILVNPMRMNWMELPDFVRFCNEINVPIWFNTIYRPYDLALWNLGKEALQDIYHCLSSNEFPEARERGNHTHHNRTVYESLVRQIRTWADNPLSEREEVKNEILHYDGTSLDA